ncbi:PhzF family phenazine biosynthesis protein [Streptomyces sp. NPDC059491]|uniref:PhzF family phenazine biosynthesis protein n=1 Tax=Streptomyces sp. NPDC059491 TaxID=3346850 RepID=UPI0036C7A5A8
MTIVRACVRDRDEEAYGNGQAYGYGERRGNGGTTAGGSPTAVLAEPPPGGAWWGDAERRRVPALAGTSHAVFVSVRDRRGERPEVSLRFFTAAGELPACGHGTLAALAYLAEAAGDGAHDVALRTAGRVFAGRSVREGGLVRASFDAGPVGLRTATAAERALVLPALGLPPGALAAGVRVATAGRPRLLVPVRSRGAAAALAPDATRLRAACDRLGLLGCCVHSVPIVEGRLPVRVFARVFAPSIGVAEDIANANSAGSLAAALLDDGARPGDAARPDPGAVDIAVDMGDHLGRPSTVRASARRGPAGPLVRLGGAAEVVGVVRPAS